MNLQEFHLSITPLGDDRYLIRTEDMAAGVPVAEVQVQWPVDQWLKRSQPAMDDPILGLLQGRSPAAHASSDLNALGAELYDSLFQQEYIRESWSRAQGIAQHRREILRLRLGFKDSRLQRLPWEVLQSHGKPLTTRVNLTFARYSADLMAAQSAHPLNLPEGDAALQVLMVIANPDDQARLNLRQEVNDIQASLQPNPGESTTKVEITVLEQPDRSTLTQALEQGRYQVLHYAGHSDFGQTGGDLHLVNRQTGLTERLTGEDLAGLLVNNQICLAVFNSCRSGHTVGDDAEMDWRQQNLVQALVNRGVQSVIAMAERIPDQVAVKFTQLLYTNIKQGYPIDLSLGRTRQALVSAFGSDQHYWALPVLYLQPEFDGYLMRRDHTADSSLDLWHLDNWATSATKSIPSKADSASLDLEPTPETVSLLDSLTTAAADGPDAVEVNLGQLVEQLSQPTVETDEPPIPANQEEVLWTAPDRQPEPDIYQALPENPTYQRPPVQQLEAPSLNQQDPVESALPARSAPPSLRRQKLTETSLLAWVALGAVGLVGTLTLGIFTAQRAGLFSATQTQTATPDQSGFSTSPASNSSEILLGQAIAAIEAQDYDTANERLAQLLAPEQLAQADDGNFLGTILAALGSYDDPDILFMKGRAHWQHYVQLEAESANSNPADLDALDTTRNTVIDIWDELRRDRPEDIRVQVAIGFAYYADEQSNKAFEAWEEAKKIEREQQLVAGTETLQNEVVLNAYAGLIMWHLYPGIENIESGGDQEHRASAEEALQNLERFDKNGWLVNHGLNSTAQTSDNPYLWLWTEDAQSAWSSAYEQLIGESETQAIEANPALDN
ncbi:MAG: CHAT domain-containing protein [Leptolyngbyaceae cyanobacterium]